MNDDEAIPSSSPPRCEPWNKGKLIGAKPPLRVSHVWSIRTKLQLEKRSRDLALFNLAIDSKLRGCDVVAMRVEDVAPNGYTLDRATVRQKKTGRPVRFELTEQTRQAIDEYLRLNGRKPGEFLFAGRERRVVGSALGERGNGWTRLERREVSNDRPQRRHDRMLATTRARALGISAPRPGRAAGQRART
jgi:integrase